MKKRFVVATNGTAAAEDQVFADRLRDTLPGVGWWHRLDDLWLISDGKGRLDAKSMRVLAKECFPNSKLLVLEIDEDGDSWAGTGPQAKEMFAWLHLHWNEE